MKIKNLNKCWIHVSDQTRIILTVKIINYHTSDSNNVDAIANIVIIPGHWPHVVLQKSLSTWCEHIDGLQLTNGSSLHGVDVVAGPGKNKICIQTCDKLYHDI